METLELIVRIGTPLMVTLCVASAWPTIRNWKA
jgi:hypothetical protein